MMRVANIYEAKTKFSQIIKDVVDGKDVVISKAGKPVARIIRYEQTIKKRKPGYWRNKITISKDFDETSQDVLDAFEGKYS